MILNLLVMVEVTNYFLMSCTKKNLLSSGILNLLLLKIIILKEKKIWFLRRNLRYGYSGNLIDSKIYGKLSLIIIFLKILYLIGNSFFLIIFSI